MRPEFATLQLTWLHAQTTSTAQWAHTCTPTIARIARILRTVTNVYGSPFSPSNHKRLHVWGTLAKMLEPPVALLTPVIWPYSVIPALAASLEPSHMTASALPAISDFGPIP